MLKTCHTLKCVVLIFSAVRRIKELATVEGVRVGGGREGIKGRSSGGIFRIDM